MAASREDAERAWLPSALLALTIGVVLGSHYLVGRRHIPTAGQSMPHDGRDERPPWDQAA